jgi:tetratricopeptide (TPR) repeat protein
MQAEIKNWKAAFSEVDATLHSLVQGIQMRIGINTGPVLLGTVGTTGEYTAIGDTVNLASRLEHAAPVGGVLVSQDTYQHVRGIFEVTPLDPVQVKGKSEPVQVYVVNARRPRSFRITSRGVEGIETRTIGREAELGAIQASLQATMEAGGVHMVSIVAEAGTGKSRLLYEFIRWLEEQHIPVRLYKGRATPDMTHVPYALIRNLLATSLEVQDSDPAAAVREKLEDGLREVLANGQDAAAHAAFIGHLLGYDYADDPHLAGLLGDARQVRDLAFHYLTQFFADSTREQASVILLEDIHWADSGSLDFIEHVAQERPDLPLMIIGLTRPVLFEEHPGWGTGPFEHLRLDLLPLSTEDARRLVAHILRKAPEVPPALADLIVERAEGSPFYVEELIKALIDEGVIVVGEEQWQVQADRIPHLKVPATLTGILQARLDNLPAYDREVLQQASVVGRVFWNKVVEHMRNPEASFSATPLLLADRLLTLEKKELIFHREGSTFAETPEYIFKHAILHDVTYESVLLRLRKVYHVQVAENLIELGGERVNEYAGRIGEHFELAEEWARAAEWYTRAGIQAQDTYAPEAAVNYYQKALGFLKKRNETEQIARKQEVSRRLGEVLNWQARYAEAADTYGSLLEIAREAGDLTAQSRAYYGLATSQGYQGDQRAALESAVRAEELARQAGSRIDLLKALWTQGSARFRLGEAGAALELGEQALKIATGLDQRGEIGRCLNLIGAAHYVMGRYRQAEEYFERALGIFQELGNRRQGMDLLSNLGVIAEARGDSDTALQRYQEALEITRQIGYRDGEIVFLTNRGGQHVALGDYNDADSDLREAIKLAGAAGSWVLALTYASLAQACLGQNRGEEALSAAQKALALGQADDSPEYVGLAWRALGMIAAQAGAPVRVQESASEEPHMFKVEECFERSASALSEAGLDGERARTLREWAKYELEQGNEEKGKWMWLEAREIFAGLDAYQEVKRMDDFM